MKTLHLILSPMEEKVPFSLFRKWWTFWMISTRVLMELLNLMTCTRLVWRNCSTHCSLVVNERNCSMFWRFSEHFLGKSIPRMQKPSIYSCKHSSEQCNHVRFLNRKYHFKIVILGLIDAKVQCGLDYFCHNITKSHTIFKQEKIHFLNWIIWISRVIDFWNLLVWQNTSASEYYNN